MRLKKRLKKRIVIKEDYNSCSGRYSIIVVMIIIMGVRYSATVMCRAPPLGRGKSC
jgi:hypothetical protein